MKIDLVIWTLNSERVLAKVLVNAEKVIGKENINQKILVDSGSKDRTIEIGKSLGWKIITSLKRGIAHQANLALNYVETEFFVSIEHDLLLNKNWFKTISEYFKDKNVSVAQGIHISTNPILYKHDLWLMYDSGIKHDAYGISIDNTMFRTEDIRSVGGFPELCPISCDRELRDEIRKINKKWIIDRNLRSWHLRSNYWNSVIHDCKYAMLRERKERTNARSDRMKLWGKIPFIQVYYSLKYLHEPRLLPYYTLHKLSLILGYFRRRCL